MTFTSTLPDSYVYSYSDPANYTFSGSVRLSNGTSLNLTGKSVQIQNNFVLFPPQSTPASGPGYFTTFDPAIIVSLPDGRTEAYGSYNITATNIPGDMNIPHYFVLLNITYSEPTANPWFTEQTGILLLLRHGSLGRLMIGFGGGGAIFGLLFAMAEALYYSGLSAPIFHQGYFTLYWIGAILATASLLLSKRDPATKGIV